MRVHEGPVARGEVLGASQGRGQLHDGVAEVVGRRRGPVPGGDPDVAGPVHLGCGATHPHRPVVPDRHRLVVARRPAALGHGADPAAVGGAVTVVAPVPEDHVAVAQVQAGPLQNGRGGLAGWVHGLVEQRRPGVHVEAHQHVRRRAPAQLVGHREDLAAGDVEHRGPGDADRRADVAARKVARGNRCPDVAGPQDRTGIGGQGVDGVVLGGDVDAPGGLEGLAVDLPVERARGPCRGRRGERHPRGVHARAERVAVIHGPRGGGIDMRRGAARTGHVRHTGQPRSAEGDGAAEGEDEGEDEQGHSTCQSAGQPRGRPSGGSGVRMGADGPTVTRRARCVDGHWAAVVRGPLGPGRRPLHNGGGPGVIGLAGRRALHLVDDVKPAGDLVPGHELAAALLDRLE